jgi:hypothetical protein
MEEKLLTGFDASISGKGTNNPEPILLKIQTPVVLPNDILYEVRPANLYARHESIINQPVNLNYSRGLLRIGLT